MMIREYKDDKKKYIVPALICGCRENNCLPDCIDGWCLIGYIWNWACEIKILDETFLILNLKQTYKYIHTYGKSIFVKQEQLYQVLNW